MGTARAVQPPLQVTCEAAKCLKQDKNSYKLKKRRHIDGAKEGKIVRQHIHTVERKGKNQEREREGEKYWEIKSQG